jgi:hypothetical protein
MGHPALLNFVNAAVYDLTSFFLPPFRQRRAKGWGTRRAKGWGTRTPPPAHKCGTPANGPTRAQMQDSRQRFFPRTNAMAHTKLKRELISSGRCL